MTILTEDYKQLEMLPMSSEKQSRLQIDTTVGDLIVAIVEAAQEASVSDSQLQQVLQQVLPNVLERCCQGVSCSFD